MCLCFSSNEQSSKVKLYMMDILSSVVQEGENLSQEVMDAILVNIVEPNKVREEVGEGGEREGRERLRRRREREVEEEEREGRRGRRWGVGGGVEEEEEEGEGS